MQKDVEIILAENHNILICKGCQIGIPFDHIIRHLKDKHGIKKMMEEIKLDHDLTENPMTSDQARDWLMMNSSIDKPISGLPVFKGFQCEICNYTAMTKQVIRNHLSQEHIGIKNANCIKECMV